MHELTVGAGEIDRRTLSSQIYGLLEQKVLSGDLSPGTRLSEEWIADAYNVSRSPAREALADLERVGLAVRVGMRDRMITVPTLEMINEKYDIWWIVDVGRSYLAAQTATPANHEELRRLLDCMLKAVKARDTKRYTVASEKFHNKIRRGCGNRSLNQLSDECDLYIRWFEMLYDQAPDCSITTVNEHTVILYAFEAQDLAALSEGVRVHMVRQRDRILQHFEMLMPDDKGAVKIFTPRGQRSKVV